MNTESGYAVPAGWYVDPGGSLQLRWWNGDVWTDNVHPIPPQIQAPAPAPATATASPSATATETETDASPAEPAPLTRRELRERAESLASAAALAPIAPRIAEVSDYQWDRESKPATTVQTWSAEPAAEITHFRDIPSRWSSVSVWLLAFTPWLTLICLVITVLVSSSTGTPGWVQVRLFLIPFLLTIGWARRDTRRLRIWGHEVVPHWAWSFLGAPGYLIARTIVLRRNAGVGAAPIWVWGANVITAAGGSVLLVFWALSLAVPQLMEGIEDVITADLQAEGMSYAIKCPRSLTGTTFTCIASDTTGTTQPISVQLDGYDGSFTYSVPGVLATQS
ncbi:DUF2510 domain-containing protein [Leifsonia sp. A12D58]|uniref:DUF2510 domain-containing protein n=1 Tax=Leifsonia sp. A12D58 TaxID=3397674 RepID=UPI0039DF6C8B